MIRVLAFLLACAALAHGATRQDVINRCASAGTAGEARSGGYGSGGYGAGGRSADRGNDTICIGYDNDDDCSADVSKCDFAFASISSAPGGRYRVQLVGKGGEWASMAFSDDEDKVMAADNLAVICVNAVEPPIQILQIADIPPNPERKSSFALDNTYLEQGVTQGKLELHDGWMICEFTLNSKLQHKGKTFDLRAAPLKLGLAVNVEDTIHGPDDMYANLPFYHGQTRGASEKKVNIFQKL